MTGALKLFRIPTLWVQGSSMSIPCASPRGNCGANGETGLILSALLSGRVILSQSDWQSQYMEALPQLQRDAGGPVFAEPWQAQAFALAVQLSAQGHFTWREWAAILAEELRADSKRGELDDGSRYYHCWLTALERLVVAKRLSDAAVLTARKEAWAEAYRRTPHGKPVELGNESRT
jgi:nitrile hydratase accessory protein